MGKKITYQEAFEIINKEHQEILDAAKKERHEFDELKNIEEDILYICDTIVERMGWDDFDKDKNIEDLFYLIMKWKLEKRD